jgi:hypothetical protein
LLGLGRRKVGIKLSTSLDLGSAKPCSNESNDEEERDESRKNKLAKSPSSSRSRSRDGEIDDDFSTPFLDLNHLGDTEKPKLHSSPRGHTTRIQTGHAIHRRSHSAGTAASASRVIRNKDVKLDPAKSTGTPESEGNTPRSKPISGSKSMQFDTVKNFAISADYGCSLFIESLPPKHKRRGRKKSLDGTEALIDKRRRGSISQLPAHQSTPTFNVESPTTIQHPTNAVPPEKHPEQQESKQDKPSEHTNVTVKNVESQIVPAFGVRNLKAVFVLTFLLVCAFVAFT